jgi:hypothetical protein
MNQIISLYLTATPHKYWVAIYIIRKTILKIKIFLTILLIELSKSHPAFRMTDENSP